MQTIDIKDVKIAPDRQRKEFNEQDMTSLVEGLLQRPLLHPISLDDTNQLIAGERRLRAVSILAAQDRQIMFEGELVPLGFIPYVNVGKLTPLEYEEIQLAENLERSDLTWQENSATIARLHFLRTGQKELVGEKQTFTQTAKEITVMAGKPAAEVTTHGRLDVANSVLLAGHLHKPEVAGAKTKKEAINIVRRDLAKTFEAELAKRVQKRPSRHTLWNTDCRLRLKDIATNSIDVIITDPPFGIDADKMSPLSGSESGAVHQYQDDPAYAKEIMLAIINETPRICKEKSHLYMFCDFRYFSLISEWLAAVGWAVHHRPMIWNKPSGGMLGDTTRAPRLAYETIIFARRGDRLMHRVGFEVITMNGVDSKRNPAEKPVSLYEDLISRSATPGNIILDPCCGTGPLFPACNRLGLLGIGMELREQDYNTALLRLDEK